MVVHCSAGVGRAGTFVAIHMTLYKLEKMALSQPCLKKIQYSIKETVAKLRNQREGTVQTVDQYIFIYKVIADAMNIRNSKRASLKSLESDHYILSLQDSQQRLGNSGNISLPPPSSPPTSPPPSLSPSPPSSPRGISPPMSGPSSPREVYFLDILSVRSTKCSTDPEDYPDPLSSSAEVR